MCTAAAAFIIAAIAITLGACSNTAPASPTAPGDSAAATAQSTSEPTVIPTFTARVVGETEPEPSVTALTTFGDAVWVAVGGAIITTDDGGTTWSRLGDVDAPPNTLSFTSPQDGWAATDSGLFGTGDGARNWLHVESLPPGKVARVRFADAAHGWVTTDDGGLQRTIDGGSTWVSVGHACARGLYAFSDADSGWTLCPGVKTGGSEARDLFATSDGGASWSVFSHGRAFQDPARAPSPFVLPDDGYATDLSFLGGQLGWIATVRAGLYATVDGGKNWQVVPLKGFSEPNADAVSFASSSRGYVIGEGAVWRTDDGGQT